MTGWLEGCTGRLEGRTSWLEGRTRWLEGRRAARAIYAVLAAEIGVLVAFSVVDRPFDLNIFLWGGHAVWHGLRLYDVMTEQNWFTYPPFAAAVFGSLTVVPGVVARLLWQFGSVAALGWACASTIRLAGARPTPNRVLAMVAAGLALEPVYQTLHLGQVNLFLFALVLADIRRIARSGQHITKGGAGIGIGLAAAVKLTPLIFIPFLLLARRGREALIAADAFAVCGLIGYLVSPSASDLYWTRLFDDTSRFSVTYISNQSVYAAAARVLGGTGRVGGWCLPLLAVIAVAGLAVAAGLARRGDWLGGATVADVTSLLVSPVSWTHHWTWIVPALVLLLRGGTGGKIAAGFGYLLFALSPMWFTPYDGTTGELGLHGPLTIAANCFTLAGLAFLGFMAWQLLSQRILLRYSPGYERSADIARPAGAGTESRL